MDLEIEFEKLIVMYRKRVFMLALPFHRKDSLKGYGSQFLGQQIDGCCLNKSILIKIKRSMAFICIIGQKCCFCLFFVIFNDDAKAFYFYTHATIYKLDFSTHLKICRQTFKVRCKYVHSLMECVKQYKISDHLQY